MKSIPKHKLICELYAKAEKEKSSLWKRIAKEVEKPSRRMCSVNLAKLSKVTRPNEWAIVPGKVLGTGELTHKLNVIALSFSRTALEKLKTGAFTLRSFLDKGLKAKPIRIVK